MTWITSVILSKALDYNPKRLLKRINVTIIVGTIVNFIGEENVFYLKKLSDLWGREEMIEFKNSISIFRIYYAHFPIIIISLRET